MSEKVTRIVILVSCLVACGFLIWMAIAKRRAALLLEQQIASGKLKIEVSPTEAKFSNN